MKHGNENEPGTELAIAPRAVMGRERRRRRRRKKREEMKKEDADEDEEEREL